MGGGLRGWEKKVKKGLSIAWQLQNSHRVVKYSIGNIVNILTTCMVSDEY